MSRAKTLYIVIPCYDEEEVIQKTADCLREKLTSLIKNDVISRQSRILFVNDGSKDRTWSLIKDLHQAYPQYFTGISLSRNRGHQNALLAGLMTAKQSADIIISMDADLQDDINVIDKMLKKYQAGAEIVYGVRSSRKKDTFFKRITAEGFYKFMKLMGVDIVFNHADYRLTSNKVLNELERYQEVNLFLRGIFPLIGYNSDIVYYPLTKMLGFAWDGISSFSVKPLRVIAVLGCVITALSAVVLLYSLIVNMLGQTVQGWTFIVCSIWLMGGMQTFFLGIIGEYIGKIYSETKARPRYCIAENLQVKPENAKD